MIVAPPSTALSITTAQAVSETLALGTFNQTFTPDFTYRPKFDLTELSELKVTVTPAELERERLDRSDHYSDIGVMVAIQKTVDPDDTEAMNAMLLLVEQISVFLEQNELEGEVDADWRGVDITPLYFPDALNEDRLFLSLPRFTFRIY